MENTERIKAIEVRLEDHDRRISVAENQSDILNKLSTYVELQTQHNAQQDKQLSKMDGQFEKITEVMQGINLNLVTLNKDVTSIKEDVSNVKGDINNVNDKVKEIEDEQFDVLKRSKEKYKDRKINNRDKIATGVVTAVLLTIVYALIELI